MPRYFFHFTDGREQFTDSTGVELSGIGAMQHAYARRYGAMTLLPPDVARLVTSVSRRKYEGSDKFVWILRDLSQKLALFDRYERRALSRRKFAIRELEKNLNKNSCLRAQ